ncbi:hypothetical protein ACO9S2_06780 [Nitrospira sp. NS4]|uniref:hypothetical protein n=1 Tax=Nitrospira sp. NS4 TaxID=3414498 RepID=UPI003C30367B
MKRRLSFISVIGLVGMALLSQAGIAMSEEPPAVGTPMPEHIGKAAPVPLKKDAADQAPTLPPGAGLSSQTIQEVPSISGRYRIGGTTVMPYLGAGFGGGFTSDVDRSINNGRSIPADPGLRSVLGQNLAPNEFRMGIRIPF